MLRGAMHVHSTYSDGELTLAELREAFLGHGCRFAVMTDHADAFTDATLRDYIDECDARSDASFRFVPSLEYGCDQRMHILGYGSTRLTDSTDPETVIRHIRASGGIPVIAHPKDAAFDWIERFSELPDGVEVWNTKYDGRYAPRPQTFRLLYRLQDRKPQTRAFYGQDLHWRLQPRVLFVELELDTASGEDIVAALADGRFTGVYGDLRLPSSGRVSDGTLDAFARVNARARRVKAVLAQVKNVAARFGATLPAPVKARLRRFF